MIALSILVVTSGRPTLTRTLDSIAAQPLAPQDEVLVVGCGPAIRAQAEAFGYRYVEDGPCGCWGQVERQRAMAHARGTHLLFLDDDDFYLAGALAAIRRAIAAAPDRPIMARMHAPFMHLTIWIDPIVAWGNVSGTQFVVPNDPARLGVWGLRHAGDLDFIESTLARYPADALVWEGTVIVGCRDHGVPAGTGREEYVPGGVAIWQSETAKAYQCPRCQQWVFTQYEGDESASVVCEGIGKGHRVRWERTS